MENARKIKIILDTSVLIAALRSGSGASAAVVTPILRLEVRMLLSYSLLCEYRDVALRPGQLAACRISEAEVEKLIGELEELAEPLPYDEYHGRMSADPNDDMVLEAAINGEVDLIVSNNIKHLREPASRFRIDVVTPKEFLEFLRRGE